MRIAVAREQAPETRVALVPDQVGRLRELGWSVSVEPEAGVAAGHPDTAYLAAGATVAPLRGADLVLAVRPPRPTALEGVGALVALTAPDRPRVPSYALDRVPRISRAQSMDALTSQSLVAGYRGAIVAAGLLREFLPLTMTAAGTVPAARVLVLGAGVAGLQVIATLGRLGAVVQGYDVRPSSAEEIASFGAVPLDLGLPSLTGASGYAREMTPERATLQQERLAPYVAAADALVTTAAVPGRPAPLLVSAAMVAAMRPGAVVVDLAADSGGNVEGAVPGELVRVGGVQVWGGRDVAAQLPGPASRLYAHNVVSLVELMTRGGRFDPDPDDEIVAACRVP